MRNIFGRKFQKLRELKGLSKVELSKRLGHKTDTYLYDLERGVFVPPLATRRRLAQALEVPSAMLEEMVMEAEIEALGITDPGFVSLFKNYPRLSKVDKQAIIKAYERVKRHQHGSHHRSGA